MNNEQIDRLLAEKVMGWHIGLDPMHGLDCYGDGDGKCVKLMKDWHPRTSIEQAMMCAEKWCIGNEDKSVSMYYSEFAKSWAVTIFEDKDYWTGSDKKLSLAISLALWEAEGGEK